MFLGGHPRWGGVGSSSSSASSLGSPALPKAPPQGLSLFQNLLKLFFGDLISDFNHLKGLAMSVTTARPLSKARQRSALMEKTFVW